MTDTPFSPTSTARLAGYHAGEEATELRTMGQREALLASFLLHFNPEFRPAFLEGWDEAFHNAFVNADNPRHQTS